MNIRINFRIEAASYLLARCGIQPRSRTLATRIANAARLLNEPKIED